MKHMPTNASVTIQRNNSPVTNLANLPVFIDQTDGMTAAYYESPAHKTFTVIFKELLDVREQDFVVEGSAHYKVLGVTNARTPHNAHSEAIVAQVWGTD